MSPIRLSQRARNTPASPIRRLAHLAHAAIARGTRVYHLNIGQPDIATPKEFFDGVRSFDQQVVAYEGSEGNRRLRDIWVEKINSELGLSLTSKELLITTGASEALIFTFMTTCDPGDEVLIFDPTYANYIGFAAISGVNLISIETTIEDNFRLPSPEEIEAHITNRTRAVLLCSPNNPTGTVYSREELQRVLDICNRENIFLVVDETYREFVYDGLEPLSVLQLEPNSDRIIVIDSLSKRYSLCGARIGALITRNQEVLDKSLSLAQARLASPSIDQFAAAHMLQELPDDFVASVRAEYEHRRDVLYDSLREIPDITVLKPQGAFYSVARLPVDDAERFAKFLLSDFSYEGETVFVAPAAGFYMHGDRGINKIRLAYVLNGNDIQKAIHVLARGLDAYRAS